MWKKYGLRIRIYVLLVSLVVITLVGGLVMVWYTYRMEGLLAQLIDRDVAAFQRAEALESALVNQKGFVSYYFLDGDTEWLRHLGQYREIFGARIEEARASADSSQEREAIERIALEYGKYTTLKDDVIRHYRSGSWGDGAKLHGEVRRHFFRVLDYCEEYRDFHGKRIREVRDNSRAQAAKLRVIAGSAVFFVLLLAILLAFILINHVLGPVRRLVLEANPDGGTTTSSDEVKALSRSVRGLIEDFDYAHMELEKSREHLLQAEKMAMVGKLAAGMAHSVRNPLTSVKMRLFSLDRTLDLSANQKEDFEVISEEIRHIDNIVQNFLEFSRPPKLKMQPISPSEIVDHAIQLLRYRLESYDVSVRVNRKGPLPPIQADPEQLKEALVNLIENACEAMEGGGSIVIDESTTSRAPLGQVVVVRLTDSGPGIPRSVQEKVFQPFFTTKEEGSGLGLSIATRIVEEHGGILELRSKKGQGATFIITLPLKEVLREHDPDH
ncbi:MAG: histidine kinase [Deltaproteobacteria bacterium]|nr:histidine kinase [Deltaproteobacteria bacterium]